MTQNFQISKRLDDGTILVIGGDNYAEFTTNVEAAVFTQENADAIFDAFNHLASIPGVTTQAVQNLNQGGVQAAPYVQPPTYQQPPTQVQPPPPVAPVAPPAAAGPVCQHGPRKWVESKPGAAKQWKAWMCPADKNDPTKCDPQWAR